MVGTRCAASVESFHPAPSPAPFFSPFLKTSASSPSAVLDTPQPHQKNKITAAKRTPKTPTTGCGGFGGLFLAETMIFSIAANPDSETGLFQLMHKECGKRHAIEPWR